VVRFCKILVVLLIIFVEIGDIRDKEKEFIMAIWERCYTKTLKFEGGFQNNPKDIGNWTGGQIGVGELKGTKYGISAKSYPNLDIENLTQDQAIAIYRRDYWDKLRLGEIDSNRIAWKIFDLSVNMGRRTATHILQKAVGVTVDGIIGHQTLEAVNKADVNLVMNEIVRLQQEHYEEIHDADNDEFFAGWMIRSHDTAPELS
jgi:lysozyme family protein